MIKIEDSIFASPEQMEFVIMGMRNPMNSWDKSDSCYGCDDNSCCNHCAFSPEWCSNIQKYIVGENDKSLMQRLSKAGSEHRKYLRMLPVWVNITAPLYWWKEFDTYKLGTVSNSCSTMHKIAAKEFTLEDFSCDHLLCGSVLDDVPNNDGKWVRFNGSGCLKDTIGMLNRARNLYLQTKDKRFWWQMIQLLPSSYNQKRSIFMNGEVLLNIYNQRWGHKLDEWREVCFFIEDCPYWDFIEPGVFKKVKGE